MMARIPASPAGPGSSTGADSLRLLYGLGEVIAASGDIHEVMAVAVRVIVENLPGTERVVLTVIDPETGTMSIENSWGLSEEERRRGVYRIGDGITGRVALGGELAVVPRISDEPEFLNRTGARSGAELAGLSFVCVPIKLGYEVLGTLSTDRARRGEAELREDGELLTVVATMLAQAVVLYRARSVENKELREENRRLKEELEELKAPGSLIGESHAMRSLYSLIGKVAVTKAPVLILGESGTGKELVASAIHAKSPRSGAPFVCFNCAAIPEALAESEMFGHERGAFTGAEARRRGRFEEADGGTLFMDEVGDVSPAVQAKLLRALQEGEFERVGSSETVKVDVRVVAATNRDLAALVSEGKFREDLYYRLAVFPICLPPLRDRGGDILLLADHFVEKYSKLSRRPVRRITTPAIDELMSYHWPGNVRELENAIQRAIILSDDGVIHSYHLPPTLQTAEASGTSYRGSLERRLAQVETELIVDALKASRGNMAQAARELGLTERVMALRVREHGIDYRMYRPKPKG
jgi:Nif-specific regulatory protein